MIPKKMIGLLLVGLLFVAVLVTIPFCGDQGKAKAQGYSDGFVPDGGGYHSTPASVAGGNANHIVWSHDYDGSWWNGSVSGDFAFFAWNGPWGGANAAELVGASGSAGSNASFVSDSFVLAGGPIYTISAWIQQSPVGAAGTMLIQLQNTTKSAAFQVAWVYPVDDTPNHSNHTGADGYAITQVDGEDAGWYRISANLDTTADSWTGDDCTFRIRPYGTDTASNHGIVIYGVQINDGAAPTAFIVKP